MLVRIWCAVVALTDRGRGGGGRSFRPSCAHLTSYPALQHTQQTSYTKPCNVEREKCAPEIYGEFQKIDFERMSQPCATEKKTNLYQFDTQIFGKTPTIFNVA